MAAKKKGSAGKGKEPRGRGSGGPPSATPNERAQGGKKGASAVPKVGKHDAGEGRSHGEGLH